MVDVGLKALTAMYVCCVIMISCYAAFEEHVCDGVKQLLRYKACLGRMKIVYGGSGAVWGYSGLKRDLYDSRVASMCRCLLGVGESV